MQSIRRFLEIPLVRLIIAIIPTILLTVVLLQPEAQPIIPTGVRPAPPSLQREILFSSAHIVSFTIVSFLWCFAFDIKPGAKTSLFAVGFALLIYGLSMEYLQSSVPGRAAQWWDVLANAIGIMMGCFLWLRFQIQIAAGQFWKMRVHSG